jgi:ERCC4-type nuclease
LLHKANKPVKSEVPARLILEGRNGDFKETDFLPQTIHGILLTISLYFRIPILRTRNTEESAAVMLQCFKQRTNDKPDK